MTQTLETDAPYRPGDMTALQDLLTYRISRINARLNSQALAILRSHGPLTLTQWRVLVALDLMGDSTMSRIVEETQLDKSMISRTVAAMLKEGQLVTRPDPADQRAQILSMTDQARKLYDAARPAMRDRQTALRAAVGGDDLPAFMRALDALDTHLEEVPAK